MIDSSEIFSAARSRAIAAKVPGRSTAASSATGSGALCLDDDEILGHAGKFLTALVERYHDNPAVMGYDLWSESNVQECFCPATQAKFREWLKAKYGTLEALSRTWHRYSLANWEHIQLQLGAPVFFCNPHSPWQRGTNENTNRLLRFWFEKSTDLSDYTKADLKRVQDKLNTRPRPTLGLDTPAQRLAALLDQAAA